jgi:hypothetical protein
MVGFKHKPNSESGYIALITVLIVSAAATAIALTMLATGTDAQRSANIQQQSKQARALAVACGQEAAQQIHDNMAFGGTVTTPLGQGSCTYTVTKTSATVRTIAATGTVGNVIKKVQASMTIGAAAVAIGTWSDVVTAGAATPAFVQIKMSSTISSVSTISATMNAVQTAGNLNVVIIGWATATGTINTVADASGNTYVLAAPIVRTTGLSQAIYYAKNITAAQPNITVTFSAAVTNPDLRVLEYSGLDTAIPFDTSVSNIGTGTPSTAGILTTNFPTELIVSGGTAQTAYTTAGSGYTLRGISTNGNIAMDAVVTGFGNYTATAPGSGNWVHQAAAFRAAGQ